MGFEPNQPLILHADFLKSLNLRRLKIEGKIYQDKDLWELFLERDAPWVKQMILSLETFEEENRKFFKRTRRLAKYAARRVDQTTEYSWQPDMAEYVHSEFNRWRKEVVKSNRRKFPSGEKNPRSKKSY